MRTWLPLSALALTLLFVPAAAATVTTPVPVETNPEPSAAPAPTTTPTPTRRYCPNQTLRQPINVGPNNKVGSGARAKSKAASTAMGLVGGLLGGGGGNGRGGGDQGPRLVKCRIKEQEMTVFTDPETGIELLVGAKRDKDGLVVFANIEESPDNGTFQTAFLENADGDTLAPSDVQICELWGEWKLTVSWTKTTYVDNQIVKQESGGWQKTGLFTLPGTMEGGAPDGIWRRLGFSNASHGARMIAMRYPIPPPDSDDDPLATVIHITRPRRDPVDTRPFGLLFQESPGGIVFQREPPADCPDGPLLADLPHAPPPPPAANPEPRPPPTTGETPPPQPEGDDPRDEDEECPWPTDRINVSMVDEGDYYKITYGTTPTYTNLGDIVKYLNNQVAPHYDPTAQCGRCIGTLEIWGHGDTAGGYISFGDNEGIAGTTKFGANINENLAALRGLMCADGKIVVNQCKAGTGQKGTNALQTFADAVGVPVSGADGKVKSCRIFGGLLTGYTEIAPSAGVATPGQNPPRDVETR